MKLLNHPRILGEDFLLNDAGCALSEPGSPSQEFHLDDDYVYGKVCPGRIPFVNLTILPKPRLISTPLIAHAAGLLGVQWRGRPRLTLKRRDGATAVA